MDAAMLATRAQLVGGPQCGAVVIIRGERPTVIYVGRRWLGDGAAAYSTHACERFPVRYWYDGRVYWFSSYT
jgi:hypothetical protein